MEISGIPVTDNRGRRIGQAKLVKDETGIKAYMILDSDVGHMLLHGMRDNMMQGLSIAPVIEPAIPAPPRQQLVPDLPWFRRDVGYIPPGMQRDCPIIGKARIDVDDQGVITRFEFFPDKD